MKYGSVCSGIEAASVAWEPLGFEPVFFSEIEAFPAAVLKHHWPHVPNHGDMTQFESWGYDHGSIDILVGGTPCQSFSVAGLRGGLGDDRGNLALTYCRMVDRFRPRWFVWENVPGVLSSNGGADFSSIISAMAQLGYSIAWRVLDAQNFGVAQRRRRVFVVGCSTGDWRDPSKVLFEQSCGTGDFEASRKTRQKDTGSPIPSVAGSLDTECGGGKLTHQSAANGHLLLQPTVARMRGFGDYTIDGTFSTTKSRDWKDATDLVIQRDEQFASSEVAPTITSSGPPYSRTGNQHSEVDALVSFSSNMSVPDVQTEIAPTLKLGGSGGANPPAISYGLKTAHTSSNGIGIQEEKTHTLEATSTPHATATFQSTHQVRRLTPTECHRLQGFPDGHCEVPWRGKDVSPDGPQYKALGNSMAVPVMRWIGERIKQQEEGNL